MGCASTACEPHANVFDALYYAIDTAQTEGKLTSVEADDMAYRIGPVDDLRDWIGTG